MTVPGVQHAALFIQNLLRLGEAADELLPCPGGVAAAVMDMGLLLGKGAGKHLAAEWVWDSASSAWPQISPPRS